MEIISRNAVTAEKPVVEAVEELAKQQKFKGKVSGVYRIGGRLLIVVGLVNDGVRIYYAEDHYRETAKVAGGWGGAAAGVAAYNTFTGPTNAAGPVAWGLNLAGNLVAGGVGYFAGERIAEAAYDIIIDPEPVELPK